MSDKLPPKILVAESDDLQNANLCNNIERYWFDVTRAKNAQGALRSAEVNPPNLVIISSKLTDLNAAELAEKIRNLVKNPKLPIIFILDSAENAGYSSSVDDYSAILNRPHSPDDLMKIIRLLLRKAKPVFQDRIISFNDIKMDLSTFKVMRGNKVVHLGPTEFKILQLFVQKPTMVFNRQQIIDYVWGTGKDIAPRTIDVHINRIRTLMKLPSDQYQLIRTIRSAGYSLN